MSRNYNFMPSRYASRQATMSLQVSVKEAVQNKDNTVTASRVLRDNHETDPGVTRVRPVIGAGLPADRAWTGGGIISSLTLDDLKERRREEGMRFLGMPTAREQARLAGRHGFTWRDATADMSMNHRTAREVASIRSAFDEGVDLRQRNVRCFCNRCLMPPEIVEREGKRWAYARRRNEELKAMGHSFDEIEKLIRDELDRGMAL